MNAIQLTSRAMQLGIISDPNFQSDFLPHTTDKEVHETKRYFYIEENIFGRRQLRFFKESKKVTVKKLN
jgi:hypothetical protein